MSADPFPDYEDFDALGLADLVRRREVTADELLDAALARAEAHEPTLHAVVHPFPDLAKRAIAAGLPEGPFTGVPMLLKNTALEAEGTILSTGSALFRDAVSKADHTLAKRYKAAGCVPWGKSNTPEFALSFTTEPTAFGPTRNPWDLSRSPGGSSGGSCAAVAAGYGPVAHASDGAGSIRVPASHTGLFGLKTSRMLNPVGPVAMEGIAGMSCPHVVSRSVRDSAAMLDATAGPDVGDAYAAPMPEKPFSACLEDRPKGLRIGFAPRSPLGTPVDPQVARIAEEAARLCEELGHHVEETEAGYDAAALKTAWKVIPGTNVLAAVEARGKALGLADPAAQLEPVNREWVEWARRQPASAYLAAVSAMHATARALGRFFQRYDVLLSPAAAEPAQELGAMGGGDWPLEKFYDRFWSHAPFTCAFNASGCPAMSVPLGMTASGLPVGVQFGAGFGRDGFLLGLAAQLEEARPWFSRRAPKPFRSAPGQEGTRALA